MSTFLLILGLVMFVGLVVVHEFGHFLAARKAGVVVEEFGIGFPPRAWGKKLKSGLMFSLNWLPIGGFVRLRGEHDSAKGEGTYGAAPLGAKIKILLAGVAMNLLAAFVIFTIVAISGMPKLIDNQFNVSVDQNIVKQSVAAGFIDKDSPAEKAGLKVDDEITAMYERQVSPKFITLPDDLKQTAKYFAGKDVNIVIKRDGKLETLTTKLLSEEEVESSKNTAEPKGYLGVVPIESQVSRYGLSAPVVSAGIILQFTKMTFVGLGDTLGKLFSGNASQAADNVAGPVRTFGILQRSSQLGAGFILMILGLISLTLAIMNVLPIPALDGGRLFVTLVFRATKKRLTKGLEEKIHGSGFAFLMLLTLIITVREVLNG